MRVREALCKSRGSSNQMRGIKAGGLANRATGLAARQGGGQSQKPTSSGSTLPLSPCGRLTTSPFGVHSRTMPHSRIPTDRVWGGGERWRDGVGLLGAREVSARLGPGSCQPPRPVGWWRPARPYERQRTGCADWFGRPGQLWAEQEAARRSAGASRRRSTSRCCFRARARLGQPLPLPLAPCT